ncbi:MAG: phenylalanine--tRNA ligase subunit beta [Candidatus Aenigmarchaeota archaeon]|nr:phenylalanine--tRNA ligase subunit beta [Candidatus Aenigmarchaeota archaeon]
MPKLEISQSDLCSLIGKKIPIESLKQNILYAKGEIDGVEEDTLKVDLKDSNRPDLWSAEGIAREIKGRVTSKVGLPEYKIKRGNLVVHVDKKVSRVRPLTVCAVVRDLKINKQVLSQMIQLQEKVATTFGRNRKEVAIGVYDFHKIKPPITYTTVQPEGIRFVPLEFKEEMTPKEILERHPKGKEFGHLLSGYNEYPIFIDSANQVLSMPPIINSDHTGKVDEETRDVFIECSGYNFKFLVPALNVIVSALADRGAKIESVKVEYHNKSVMTPDLLPKKAVVDIDYVNKVSGLKLKPKDIVKLLLQARYNPVIKGKRIEVHYPAYRQDIMHPRDVVEDVIISYGYNKVEPLPIKYKTLGKMNEMEEASEKIGRIMSKLGMQEIMSYTLTNKDHLFRKMNVKEEKIVEIENPVSANWNIFRNWMIPSLMEFFSNNQHVKYPQKIFEIGNVVAVDEKQETRTRDIRKLAAAIADSKLGYHDIVAVLDGFMRSWKKKYRLRKTSHSSFIEGRMAEILVDKKTVGVIGEIRPEVLLNWKLEMPVCVFELEIA